MKNNFTIKYENEKLYYMFIKWNFFKLSVFQIEKVLYNTIFVKEYVIISIQIDYFYFLYVLENIRFYSLYLNSDLLFYGILKN